jgi:hypothetical protein
MDLKKWGSGSDSSILSGSYFASEANSHLILLFFEMLNRELSRSDETSVLVFLSQNSLRNLLRHTE